MLFSLLRQIPSAVPPAGKRCSWLSREAIWWEGGRKSLPHPKRSPLLLCALGGGWFPCALQLFFPPRRARGPGLGCRDALDGRKTVLPLEAWFEKSLGQKGQVDA